MIKNQNYPSEIVTGLRALSHPAALLSIVLLLLNDHYFKSAYPSALTGKLSDFAGLFFFPFLLALILSLLSDRLNLPPRTNASAAFTITGLWFTAIKILPGANRATENLVAWLTGKPAQIILDPTDLIALLSLLAAWRLWEKQAQRPPQPVHRRTALLAISLAVFGTLATSRMDLPPTRVAVQDGVIYISDDWLSGFETSADGGETWIRYREYTGDKFDLTDSLEVLLQEEVLFPKKVCTAFPIRTCYRTNADLFIEKSLDGEKTWETAWQISAGRREFMKRSEFFSLYLFSSGADLSIRDLEVLEIEDSHRLIAALGDEGILIYYPDGAWQRLSSIGGSPTQMKISVFTDFATFGIESLIITTITIIIFARLSKSLKEKYGYVSSEKPAKRNHWFVTLLIFGFLLILMAITFTKGLLFVFLIKYILANSVFQLIVLWSIIGYGYMKNWRGHFTHIKNRQLEKSWVGIVIYANLVFFVSLLPLALWGYAVIDSYEIALGISIAILLTSLTLGWIKLRNQIFLIAPYQSDSNPPSPRPPSTP